MKLFLIWASDALIISKVFSYIKKELGKRGLQTSTLPEINENPTKFWPQNFLLLPFYVKVLWRPKLILGFRCLDSRLEFSCIQKWPRAKIHYAENRQKRGQIWTSGLLSYTLSRKNPVVTKWNNFYFRMQMPWYQKRVFLQSHWTEEEGLQRSIKQEIYKKPSRTWTSALLSRTLSRRNLVKPEWHPFDFRLQMSLIQNGVFLYREKSDRLQRSTLTKIDKNESGFELRSFFLIPFHVRIQWQQCDISILGCRCLDFSNVFSYIKIEWGEGSAKIHFVWNKRYQYPTSTLHFYTILGKNPVATKWHLFFFELQMPWFKKNVFLYWINGGGGSSKIHFAGNLKKQPCRIWT